MRMAGARLQAGEMPPGAVSHQSWRGLTASATYRLQLRRTGSQIALRDAPVMRMLVTVGGARLSPPHPVPPQLTVPARASSGGGATLSALPARSSWPCSRLPAHPPVGLLLPGTSSLALSHCTPFLSVILLNVRFWCCGLLYDFLANNNNA